MHPAYLMVYHYLATQHLLLVNLSEVSTSHYLPRARLYTDNLSIILTIRYDKSLTLFRASMSRNKPTNSWLHMDNFSNCHTNSWLHMDNPLSNQYMVYLFTGTISNLLHMDNQLLIYNWWQTEVHHSHPSCTHMHQPHLQWQQCAGPHLQQPQCAGPVIVMV
jgi:hypothetical protein